MSSATVSPPGANAPLANPAPAGAPLPGEACPLCGSALHPEQEWCLRCGAAARTRLAASPNWKTPLAIVLVLLALSLGVLAAALVKLAGDSGPGKAASTTTVTSAAAPTPTTPQSTAPATGIPSTSTPASSTPAATTTNGAAGKAGKAGTPGASTTGQGTTAPRTGSSSSPATGLGGVGKALEERLRKQAAKRGRSGK